MYSAYKLNKASDNIQHWHTPFPIVNQSIVPYPLLTVASWPVYRFHRRQIKCSGIPISLRIFHSVLWSAVKGPGIVSEAKAVFCFFGFFFAKFSCFSHDPTDIDNLISGSSAFSNSSLDIWKFLVDVLPKPGLENFEHYFARMWNECSWAVVWIFFGIDLLWDWASLVAQLVKNPPAMWETYIQSGMGRSLEKGKATHFSILSVGSQRVTHDWMTFNFFETGMKTDYFQSSGHCSVLHISLWASILKYR